MKKLDLIGGTCSTMKRTFVQKSFHLTEIDVFTLKEEEMQSIGEKIETGPEPGKIIWKTQMKLCSTANLVQWKKRGCRQLYKDVRSYP